MRHFDIETGTKTVESGRMVQRKNIFGRVSWVDETVETWGYRIYDESYNVVAERFGFTDDDEAYDGAAEYLTSLYGQDWDC